MIEDRETLRRVLCGVGSKQEADQVERWVLRLESVADDCHQLRIDNTSYERLTKEQDATRIELERKLSTLSTVLAEVTAKLEAANADQIATSLRLDAYRELLATAYQLAGLVGAPVRFLDAYSRPDDGANIDSLLPVDLKEIEEVENVRLANVEAKMWVDSARAEINGLQSRLDKIAQVAHDLDRTELPPGAKFTALRDYIRTGPGPKPNAAVVERGSSIVCDGPPCDHAAHGSLKDSTGVIRCKGCGHELGADRCTQEGCNELAVYRSPAVCERHASVIMPMLCSCPPNECRSEHGPHHRCKFQNRV